MTAAPAISARGLRKRYGDRWALDGCDLDVAPGAIHGLLGPNGAGKSTAVRALTTLIDLDGGTATVAGHDVGTEARAVRERIGLIGQSPALDEILGGRQNLVMFGRLFGLGDGAARRRADELLEAFELTGAATTSVSTYSGGMRRRLDIAVGLILTPVVLFLDEPTTGLDPRARNEVWRMVREIAAAGTTVLLTTQYLDEADQLAANISVMNHGRVVAEGTPDLLKAQIGGDRVTLTLARPDTFEKASRILSESLGIHPTATDADDRSLTFEIDTAAAGVFPIVRALDAAAIAPEDLVLRRPTLDEVFLHLTAAGSER